MNNPARGAGVKLPSEAQETDREMLENLQRESFGFFFEQIDDRTGLIVESTQPNSPGSISSVGMGLTSYVAAVERGFLSKAEAVRRSLKVLRFLKSSHQGPEPDASGYRGFFYHFLDMKTGKRAWDCELSSIDTAFLMAGILTLAQYFAGDNSEEKEIRDIASELYRRVDWAWMQNGENTLTHGWKPGSGFLPNRWDRCYSEAILLYVLALGSPTFPVAPQGYREWTSTFDFKKFFDCEYIFAAPLFIHQFSHMWIDFRGIRDDINKKYNLDYFENSRRATLAQQAYAIANPRGFKQYGKYLWGLTASDGPGEKKLVVDGREREFHGYLARGAPDGKDDGTVSPWAAAASLPFCPEIVINTIRHAVQILKLRDRGLYGFDASCNFTFPDVSRHQMGWISPWRLGINQGAVVIMLENFFSETIWKCMKKNGHVVQGLKRAGFSGGWLEET